MKIREEIIYISPGRKKLKTAEELFYQDSQNTSLVAPKKSIIIKTVELVLTSIWK